MPSLSDKLKALGVKVGAQNIAPPPRQTPAASPAPILEQALSAHRLETPLGETYLVEKRYPADYRHGQLGLLASSPLQVLADWAGDRRISDFSPQSFAFLDTETTGLMGGAGTYAFLIGAGRFEGDEFHLAQFFMQDPLEEPAQLTALEQFLAPCQALVTFNGKAFDVPILNARYVTHGWRPPYSGTAHVDLLHLARRLWRDRLPSRTLGNLEVQILGTERSEDDVPGWMIPSLYFQYLRDRDPAPLRSVFYHNAMDVVSLAALFNHVSSLLADPFGASLEHGVDVVALAKLFEDLGDLDAATRLYIHALDHEEFRLQQLPLPSLLEAISRLAAIHKRQDNFPAAVQLWEQAARHNHIEAHIELAKFYEHRLRDIPAALEWTQSAIDLLDGPGFSAFERRQWLSELHHRRDRLNLKNKNGS